MPIYNKISLTIYQMKVNVFSNLENKVKLKKNCIWFFEEMWDSGRTAHSAFLRFKLQKYTLR